jgi:hypothetical protein
VQQLGSPSSVLEPMATPYEDGCAHDKKRKHRGGTPEPTPWLVDGSKRHKCPQCGRHYKGRDGYVKHFKKAHATSVPRVAVKTRPTLPHTEVPVVVVREDGDAEVTNSTVPFEPFEWSVELMGFIELLTTVTVRRDAFLTTDDVLDMLQN